MGAFVYAYLVSIISMDQKIYSSVCAPFIFVTLLMMFATKGQSKEASLLPLIKARLCTSDPSKPHSRWKPFNGIWVMRNVAVSGGLMQQVVWLIIYWNSMLTVEFILISYGSILIRFLLVKYS